ncbi:MAG TPA: type 4b pilus protein PilO2 [Alphaproteobacteria bacterium]|nr:hypothetical protein [Rhodospirillaceae bacterium]HRJ12706.1 type 4b pilus protein PilO2 [Alphaproteobacteria bacterium]
MTAGVVTVGGTKYAAGLYWQPSPDKNIANAARAAAKQPGFQAEFFCVRPGGKAQSVGQFGLGIAAAGHRSGMPSLAACLANQQNGSWAGAFRVAEGLYFIAVRDDLIDPDGDAWFAHDDDAHARLEQEISRGGLAEVYCPSEWGVQGSEATGITSILTGRRDVTLQDVGVPKSLLYGLFAVLLIGAIGYGGFSYWQTKENERIAREQAAMQAQMNANMPTIEYPKSWQDAPLPMQYLKACEQALANLQASYLGWSLNSLSCSGTTLSASWSRGGGAGYAELPAGGKAQMDASLTTANISVPLENIPPRGPETLAYYGLIDEAALYKNWPVSLVLLPDDMVAVAENQPPPPPPLWRKRSVTYTLSSAPWLRPDLFESVPGLIITSVTQPSQTNFTVEGIIYENKQPE